MGQALLLAIFPAIDLGSDPPVLVADIPSIAYASSIRSAIDDPHSDDQDNGDN
jgi:hypothetical protein